MACSPGNRGEILSCVWKDLLTPDLGTWGGERSEHFYVEHASGIPPSLPGMAGPLAPLPLTSRPTWLGKSGWSFPVSVFDLEDGNPIVSGDPRQEVIGEARLSSSGLCGELHFPARDQVARVLRPQSCLQSPQLPAQGVSFPTRRGLPGGEDSGLVHQAQLPPRTSAAPRTWPFLSSV